MGSILSREAGKSSLVFTGKSQEAPQLAVGRNGKRGFGGGRLHYGFFPWMDGWRLVITRKPSGYVRILL